MKTTLLAAVLLLLPACNYVLLPGNDPDSGVICFSSVSPAGSGTTQGAEAFAAGASYQSAAQILDPDDGGVVSAQLSLSLLKKAVACVDRADAGNGDGFFATVVAPGADRVGTGTWTTRRPDAGAYFVAYLGNDGGFVAASEGSLTLTAVQHCAVSGSFDVKFPTGDGGLAPLTGTFNSEFCNR
jgi:hypothetical protein